MTSLKETLIVNETSFGMFKINWLDGKGGNALPGPLRGSFTTRGEAERNISLFYKRKEENVAAHKSKYKQTPKKG